MKIQDYRRLKKQAHEVREKAIEQAEQTYAKAIAAIETVWRMEHPKRSRVNTNTSPASAYGNLAQSVRKALELVPHRFTKRHIITALDQIITGMGTSVNANSLSGCLYRLKKEGVIQEVVAGKGRAPAQYELVDSDTDEISAEKPTTQ